MSNPILIDLNNLKQILEGIKNKIPNKTSQLTNDENFIKDSELKEVAKTGSYNDLTDKPTIHSIAANSEKESEELLEKIEIDNKVYKIQNGNDYGISIVDGLICCTWEE